jgi:hypothetical protein
MPWFPTMFLFPAVQISEICSTPMDGASHLLQERENFWPEQPCCDSAREKARGGRAVVSGRRGARPAHDHRLHAGVVFLCCCHRLPCPRRRRFFSCCIWHSTQLHTHQTHFVWPVEINFLLFLFLLSSWLDRTTIVCCSWKWIAWRQLILLVGP